MSTPPARPIEAAVPPPLARCTGSFYVCALNWSFAFFSTTRLLAYLPTLWAIHTSGDSSQHSLATWITWLGSNLVMAAWLYEHNGRRAHRAVLVTLGNGVMCGAACVFIACYR